MTKSLKILVLDDHVDVAASIGEILELDGHEVTLVHNGINAIAAYKNSFFDIGLFDVKMPGINGVDSFLEIRKMKPHASVIMMSGYADDGVIERAIENGALGPLRKPFEVDELIQRIDEATVSA